MNINVDLISKVIIPILGAIITYVLIPLIKAKYTQQKIDNVYSWVKKGVFAAEQLHKAGLISIPKKEYVIDFLNSKNIKITIEELNVLIESAVRELNIEQKAILY